MAATVQIVEKNGAGGTATNKTSDNIRFKNADNATVDTSDPLVVPAADYDYSYEKWLRLNVTVAPDTQISNIGVYSDGSNGMGTGVEVYAKAVETYATPAAATGTDGYTSVFSYVTGDRLSLGAGPFTGTGEKGNHAVLMCRVASTASSGVTSGETITFGWDEI